MFDLLIKNIELITDKKTQVVNIGITEGKFASIDTKDHDAHEVVDLKGLSAFPGIIDTQVHFRDPGLTHKEDLESGSKGAALGGVTAFFEMPNTKPPTIDVEQLEKKIELAKTKSHCDFAFFAGATKHNLSELQQMITLPGCCGVKIFMGSSTGNLLVSEDVEVEKILKGIESPIAVHSEDEDMLVERQAIQENAKNVHAHYEWRNAEVALSSTQRLIGLAEKTNSKVHVLHLTTKDEVEFLGGKRTNCSIEITPQHLYFSAPQVYDQFGTLAQMNPPIRTKEHQEALRQALKEEFFNLCGSDHAAHTLEEKQLGYPKSPSGMTGVQTLPLALWDLVAQGLISKEYFVRLTSKNVIDVFGIKNKGEVKVGNDADLSIFDLKTSFKIEKNWIASKSGWSLFEDHEFSSKPVSTIVRGNFTCRDGVLTSSLQAEVIKFNHNET
ncbi:MAG: dihydroorotase [Bdellovibrionales bacterium]